ncbi:nucleoside hydrolase [Flavobacterium limnophilum]|uniref:nucleoside hydrolase n=1 Tax=Flavobacterium limnophilum TaxID=3003262 RepID=UPI002482260D|nr:nucleoside hydrolase [Flavobacterium limnophilum]
MKHIQRFLIGLILLQGFYIYSQNNSEYFSETVKPRIRVIIDNDFGGDPDGLFQLAHHILSPSVEIKGIIGSQHYKGGFYGSPGTATYACDQVNELLSTMQLTGKIPVFEGGANGLLDIKTPIPSEGAKAIIKEAMREDTKMPLYVVCGAGLTNIASAYLMEPRIAKKIILVWIGGPEYQGLAIPPPKGQKLEYNLGIDVKACQVIFNVSDIPIWQVPRDAYRQALYSYPELVYKIKSNGITGKYIVEKLEDLMKRAKRSLGEAYVLGDSPLVLLTALQTSWETDPASCKYVMKSAPGISDSGLYEETSEGRKIRVYTNLDTRLMLEDFVAKLALFKKAKI